MGARDPRVDAYIASSAEFARPILAHLREVVHAACPDVEETVKWNAPHFTYKGLLCNMAAFKQHCSFGFWKGALVVAHGERSAGALGQCGRITKLADLPPRKVLAGYIKTAMALNESGARAPARATPQKASAAAVPDDLAALLDADPQAGAAFETFSPSHRREYIAWINEAKTDATRKRRLETAVAWMAEGKPRNWKYMPGGGKPSR